MKALAITDHGALYGVIPFIKSAREAGIHPIVGCEIYFIPSRADTSETLYHFTLLAQNERGFHHLIQMVTDAHLRGFYRKPRVDWDTLARWSDGLILLTGCEQSIVSQAILSQEVSLAEKVLQQLRDIFPSRLYVEIQQHHRPLEKTLNAGLVALAKKHSLPVCATNDVHYLRKTDAPLQDIVICIQTNTTLSDPKRLKFENAEYYLKSPEEMEALFSEIPEAVNNTVRIAEMCEDYLHLPVSTPQFPAFPIPEGYASEEEFFEELCRSGLLKKVKNPKEEYWHRLEYEMKIIKELGFIPYFLVVWDIIRCAREQGIPVGPGRGSSAGSLVAYCLDITRVDPVKYCLLFERFLNPSRKELPDIDVDFCGERREEIIQYVRTKYRQENVAQIITFGKMLSRAAVRDVARVMNLPLALADQVAKNIPFGSGIAEALRQEPELARLYQTNPSVQDLLLRAQQVEGIVRNASVHAGGVVIGARALSEQIPLRFGKNNIVVTQFAMDDLKDLGLVKMDFLGLRNLTMRDRIIHRLSKSLGKDLNPDEFPLDDRKTYRIFQKGDTTGIFQFESDQARRLCREVAPNNLEELTAINAMNRPGPLISGTAQQFINRKKKKEPITYLHPLLRSILSDTYGVVLYQEQVMQIAMALADFTPVEADELRKAMGSKETERMERLSAAFLTGAENKGVPPAIARQIFSTLLEFARYALNKSHSVSYAFLAYQLAYLKAHYPLEFFTELLNSVIGNEEKTAMYLHELRLKNIPFYPVDIQHSGPYFDVEGDGIRMGLMCVKKVGFQHCQHIVSVRSSGGMFRSFQDFLSRVDLHLINKGIIENLVKSGAMDSLQKNRLVLIHQLENLLNQAHTMKEKAGALPLFSFASEEKEQAKPIATGEISEAESFALLEEEKKVLGFYISGHPFEPFTLVAQQLSIPQIQQVRKMEDGSHITTAGFVSQFQIRSSKKGFRFARGVIEDLTGMLSFQIPPRLIEEPPVNWMTEKVLILQGRLSHQYTEEEEEGRAMLLVDKVHPLRPHQQHQDESTTIKPLTIFISETALSRLDALKDLLQQFPGSIPVHLHLQAGPREKKVPLPEEYWVNLHPDLLEHLKQLGFIAQPQW